MSSFNYHVELGIAQKKNFSVTCLIISTSKKDHIQKWALQQSAYVTAAGTAACAAVTYYLTHFTKSLGYLSLLKLHNLPSINTV